MVVDGETGLLVPPGDPAALAAAIRQVLADPELGARMGTAGRRRVEEKFTWEAIARQTVEAYEEAIGIYREASAKRSALAGGRENGPGWLAHGGAQKIRGS